jgi:hypothetical protein
VRSSIADWFDSPGVGCPTCLARIGTRQSCVFLRRSSCQWDVTPEGTRDYVLGRARPRWPRDARAGRPRHGGRPCPPSVSAPTWFGCGRRACPLRRCSGQALSEVEWAALGRSHISRRNVGFYETYKRRKASIYGSAAIGGGCRARRGREVRSARLGGSKRDMGGVSSLKVCRGRPPCLPVRRAATGGRPYALHTRPKANCGDTPLLQYSIIPPFRAKQTQFRAGQKEGQVPCG